MPVLDNPRHERLAHALAKGKTYEEAGIEAGYAGNRGSICEMLDLNPNISERVKELQQTAAEKAGVTIEWLVNEWLDLNSRAKQSEDFTANAKALESLSRHKGFFKDDNIQKNGLTPEEMLARIKSERT